MMHSRCNQNWPIWNQNSKGTQISGVCLRNCLQFLATCMKHLAGVSEKTNTILAKKSNKIWRRIGDFQRVVQCLGTQVQNIGMLVIWTWPWCNAKASGWCWQGGGGGLSGFLNGICSPVWIYVEHTCSFAQCTGCKCQGLEGRGHTTSLLHTIPHKPWHLPPDWQEEAKKLVVRHRGA